MNICDDNMNICDDNMNNMRYLLERKSIIYLPRERKCDGNKVMHRASRYDQMKGVYTLTNMETCDICYRARQRGEVW